LEARPGQANAYYGLATALEAGGDLEGALGAMRTYVHLEAPDAPFLRKAAAAIWEWETRLRDKRAGTTMAIPPGAVTLDGKKVTSPEQMLRDEHPAVGGPP
jgi:hypothetical protein